MDKTYCYPPSYTVLKNKLDLQDRTQLDVAERLLVNQRIEQGCPQGNFDLAHLQAIHYHLFQDIYEWAGQIRTVEISKGNEDFQFRQFIETGMADVHKRIIASRYKTVSLYKSWRCGGCDKYTSRIRRFYVLQPVVVHLA